MAEPTIISNTILFFDVASAGNLGATGVGELPLTLMENFFMEFLWGLGATTNNNAKVLAIQTNWW
jgi:ribonuclease HI